MLVSGDEIVRTRSGSALDDLVRKNWPKSSLESGMKSFERPQGNFPEEKPGMAYSIRIPDKYVTFGISFSTR
jgi:hypothetical protein